MSLARFFRLQQLWEISISPRKLMSKHLCKSTLFLQGVTTRPFPPQAWFPQNPSCCSKQEQESIELREATEIVICCYRNISVVLIVISKDRRNHSLALALASGLLFQIWSIFSFIENISIPTSVLCSRCLTRTLS